MKRKAKKKHPQLSHIDISVCLCAFFPATYLPVGQSKWHKVTKPVCQGPGSWARTFLSPQSFWAGPLRSCDPACVPRGLEIQAFWIEIKEGPALMDRRPPWPLLACPSLSPWDIDNGNLKPTKWLRTMICSSENVNSDKVLEFSGLNFFIFKKETSSSYLIRLLWGLNEEIVHKALTSICLLLNFSSAHFSEILDIWLTSVVRDCLFQFLDS